MHIQGVEGYGAQNTRLLQYKQFLACLTSRDKKHSPDPIVFLQCYAEVPNPETGMLPTVKDYFPMALSAIDQGFEILSGINREGYSVNVALHEFGSGGDVSLGRVKENCSRVRCFAVDVDQAVEVSVIEWLIEALKPSLMVSSSRVGDKFKVHLYWLIGDLGEEIESELLENWKMLQKALAYRVEDILIKKFSLKKPITDKNISILSKTLRLPGFLHQKNLKETYLSKLLVCESERVIANSSEFRDFFSYLNIDKAYLQEVKERIRLEKKEKRLRLRLEREKERVNFRGERLKAIDYEEIEDSVEGYFGAEKGERNVSLLEYVTRLVFVKQFTHEEALAAASFANEKYNVPPLEEHEVESMVESSYERYLEGMTEKYRERVERGDSFALRYLLSESVKKLSKDKHEKTFQYDYSNKDYFSSLTSDASVAARVLQKYGEEIAIHPEGQLMVYNQNSGLWEVGDNFVYPKIRNICSDIAKDPGIADMFCDKKGNFKEEKFETFKEKLFSTRKTLDVIKQLKSSSKISLELEHINADPYLLHAVNGVVDIRTGKISPHNSRYLMTYSLGYPVTEDFVSLEFYHDLSTGFKYVNSIESNIWLKFIYEIMDGDLDMCRYLQKIMGYALSGDNPHELIFFLYGTGANGKSIFIETALHILGKYSFAVPVSVFMANSRENKSSIMAQLPGKRLISTSEVGQDKAWDEEVIKNMGGADRVNARQLFSKSIDYRPGFKTFVRGNHKPVIKGTDHGIWRKIRLVPFDVTIPEDKRDIHLRNKLKQHEVLQQIFIWAIAGYRLYLEEGIKMPAKALRATEEYRHESNPIGAYIEECLEKEDIDKDGLTLYQILDGYNNVWRKEAGHERLTPMGMSKSLNSQGYKTVRKQVEGVRNSYFNLKFREDSEFQKQLENSIKNKVTKLY